MSEHKNTILAIVLSLLVVVGWQYFIGYPQMEQQQQKPRSSSRNRPRLSPARDPVRRRRKPGTRRSAGSAERQRAQAQALP